MRLLDSVSISLSRPLVDLQDHLRLAPIGGRVEDKEVADSVLDHNWCHPTLRVDSSLESFLILKLIEFLFLFLFPLKTLCCSCLVFLSLDIYFQTWAFGCALVSKASVYLLSSFL